MGQDAGKTEFRGMELLTSRSEGPARGGKLGEGMMECGEELVSQERQRS